MILNYTILLMQKVKLEDVYFFSRNLVKGVLVLFSSAESLIGQKKVRERVTLPGDLLL